MPSIVQELQKDSISKTTPITDLLRKSLIVAKKLKVSEFESWIQNELDGYANKKPDEIPSYRHLRGVPQVWNPYHGWQPIMFENSNVGEVLSARSCHQSIAEVEHMLDGHKPGGHFEIAYPGETARELMDAIGMNLQPTLHVSAASINRILDSVRNIVLNWALKLEEDGILGDGLSFSSEEVKTAVAANYTVNHFNGDIINSQVQQGTTASTQSQSNVSFKSVESALTEILREAFRKDATSEQKELIQSYADTLLSQAKLPSQHRDLSIIKRAWDNLGKLSTTISLGESLVKYGPLIMQFFSLG